MKQLFILGIVVLALAGTAIAQNFGSTYDPQSGNTYNWNHDSLGNTNVYGYNPNTTSQWNTTIQPNGDMHGLDSDSDYWTYQRGSDTYMNFGTGKTCVAGNCFGGEDDDD